VTEGGTFKKSQSESGTPPKSSGLAGRGGLGCAGDAEVGGRSGTYLGVKLCTYIHTVHTYTMCYVPPYVAPVCSSA
jgi:hypothetical protein